jgi:ribonucleoside-diphosphate reductase beta chain
MTDKSENQMSLMNVPKCFDINGDDSKDKRKIWQGTPTNIIQLNDVRYTWAIKLYQQMRDQFWIPQKIGLTQDVLDYPLLTEPEMKAYNGLLSYLTFLDSIQTINLPHIKRFITAPEINICLTEQASQEALHNASYQYMIETIIPAEQRDDIYYVWREDKELLERSKFIGYLYQKFIDEPSETNYFISLVADYLLEGIYFYHGFIFFYTLASRNLMPGSADIFRLINRDELSHVRLFQELMRGFRQYSSYDEIVVYQLFEDAVWQEIHFSKYMLDGVLGISEQSIEAYIKYLANIRLKAIGLDELYPGFDSSPYTHLEKISNTKSDGFVKGNYFESTVTEYNMASALDGWDF